MTAKDIKLWSTLPNSPYQFKENATYRELKEKWNQKLLKRIEDNEEKIKTFYTRVLPSFACQLIFPSKSNEERFVCLFKLCRDKHVSFVSKPVYIRHLLSQHKQLLPGEGQFLSPRSNFASVDSLTCPLCKAQFKRKDNYNQHITRCKKIYKSKDEVDSDDDSSDDEVIEIKSKKILSSSSSEEEKDIIEIKPTKANLQANSENVKGEVFTKNKAEDDDENKPSKENDSSPLILSKKLSPVKRDLSSYSICGNEQKKSKNENDDEAAAADAVEDEDPLDSQIRSLIDDELFWQSDTTTSTTQASNESIEDEVEQEEESKQYLIVLDNDADDDQMPQSDTTSSTTQVSNVSIEDEAVKSKQDLVAPSSEPISNVTDEVESKPELVVLENHADEEDYEDQAMLNILNLYEKSKDSDDEDNLAMLNILNIYEKSK